MDFSASSRQGTSEQRVEEDSGERNGNVEDDLDRYGAEGLRSCDVAGNCKQPMFLEELKAKKKKTEKKILQYAVEMWTFIKKLEKETDGS